MYTAQRLAGAQLPINLTHSMKDWKDRSAKACEASPYRDRHDAIASPRVKLEGAEQAGGIRHSQIRRATPRSPAAKFPKSRQKVGRILRLMFQGCTNGSE